MIVDSISFFLASLFFSYRRGKKKIVMLGIIQMIIDDKQSMRLVSQGSDIFLFSLQRGKKEFVMV